MYFRKGLIFIKERNTIVTGIWGRHRDSEFQVRDNFVYLGKLAWDAL